MDFDPELGVIRWKSESACNAKGVEKLKSQLQGHRYACNVIR